MLIVDTDEQPTGDIEGLQAEILSMNAHDDEEEEAGADAIIVPVIHLPGYEPEPQLRVLRTDVRYQGRVHNYAEESLYSVTGGRPHIVRFHDFQLVHTGYVGDEATAAKLRSRLPGLKLEMAGLLGRLRYYALRYEVMATYPLCLYPERLLDGARFDEDPYALTDDLLSATATWMQQLGQPPDDGPALLAYQIRSEARKLFPGKAPNIFDKGYLKDLWKRNDCEREYCAGSKLVQAHPNQPLLHYLNAYHAALHGRHEKAVRSLRAARALMGALLHGEYLPVTDELHLRVAEAISPLRA